MWGEVGVERAVCVGRWGLKELWGEVGVERAVCVGRWGLKKQCVWGGGG